ncbi:MAG: MoxR family ATPase [bacterium]
MARTIRRPLDRLLANVEKVIKGKTETIENAIIGILARGHVLFEDVPGVGKTTLAHVLARSLECSFQRIQFTSDLLPSDILGVTIFNQESREFEFKPGPIFANLVLVDEINRTTPKTQSALLEAMNTAQVSIDKITHELPRPFIVFATQNPIEFHGTFPLPKSQLDRFLIRLHIGYPDAENERTILKEQRGGEQTTEVEPVLVREEIIELQEAVHKVKVDDDLLEYITRIANATRSSDLIELGLSTRGSLALRRCAQAKAYFENRDFVTPDDIKAMVLPVVTHRIQVAKTFERGGFNHREDRDVLTHVLNEVEVPL